MNATALPGNRARPTTVPGFGGPSALPPVPLSPPPAASYSSRPPAAPFPAGAPIDSTFSQEVSAQTVPGRSQSKQGVADELRGLAESLRPHVQRLTEPLSKLPIQKYKERLSSIPIDEYRKRLASVPVDQYRARISSSLSNIPLAKYRERLTSSLSSIPAAGSAARLSRIPRFRAAGGLVEPIVRGLILFLLVGLGLFVGGAFIGGILAPGSASAPQLASFEPLELDADDVPDVVPTTLIERAAHGQDSALLELDLKAPRKKTFEEVVAVSEGRELRDQQEARELSAQFIKTPPDQLTRELVDQMLKNAGNPHTLRQAQLGFARYPHAMGPDLLYRTVRVFRKKPDVVQFASSLLMTAPVRARASDALQVLLDAWDTSSCQEARSLLGRAYESGDRRSIRHLAKFASTHGCGDEGSEDCYPCLRDDRLLVNSLRAAQQRPGPSLP